MRALLLATRARLRATVLLGGLAYENGQCEIGWDGQPPPMAGQVFVAVHPGAVRSDHDLSLRETVALDLTLSMKTGGLPVDRYGEQSVVLATTGIYARAEAIRALLHMNYTVLNDANAGQSYSIGASDNGFVEPLKFLSMTPPQERGPEWFWGESEFSGDAPAGLSITLSFGNAVRVQVIEEQS